MTRSIIRFGIWAVAVIGIAGGTAVAQPPYTPGGQPVGPASRPAFSPYLNLLRSSNSPGVNYYGLVRPQVQAQQAISALQTAVAGPAVSPFDTFDATIPVTGQPFGYMTHTRYFLNNRTGGPGATRGAVVGGGIGVGNFGTPPGSGLRR